MKTSPHVKRFLVGIGIALFVVLPLAVLIFVTTWAAPFREFAKNFDLESIELPQIAVSDHERSNALALEDPYFFSHNGRNLAVSIQGTFRNWIEGRAEPVPGSPTLTYRVAFEVIEGRSYGEAVQAYFLVPYLENRFTKNEILQIYFGSSRYKETILPIISDE